MRIRITGGDEQKWYHNLFGYKFDVANIDLDGDYVVDPGDFRPEVGPIAWVSKQDAVAVAESVPVPIRTEQSVDSFTDRELRLIKNCVNHVNDDPAGLPGHNLIVIIAKFAKLHNEAPKSKPITVEDVRSLAPQMSLDDIALVVETMTSELLRRSSANEVANAIQSWQGEW